MDVSNSFILEDATMTQDESIDPSNIVQHPVHHHSWRCLVKGVGHWKCFCLTVLIYTSLAVITWCQLTPIYVRLADASRSSTGVQLNPFNGRSPPGANSQYTRDGIKRKSFNHTLTEIVAKGPCDSGYISIPVSFLVLLYLIYLLECWNCPTRIELLNVVSAEVAYAILEELRKARPVLWWKVICYHYIRRHRNPTRYRNGSTFSASPYYYERVTSFCSSAGFDPSLCGFKDASRRVSDLEESSVTRINFSKAYSFTCPEAEAFYEAQRRSFFAEYETLDDYTETREGIDLLNVHMPDTLIVVSDSEKTPFYLSPALFFLASILLLSWPLRLVINYRTAYIKFHVHKIFGNLLLGDNNRRTNYSVLDSYTPAYSLPPSYSEALRLFSGAESPEDDQPGESYGNSDLPAYTSQDLLQELPSIENATRQPGNEIHGSRKGRWSSLGSININRLKETAFRGLSLTDASNSTAGTSSRSQQIRYFRTRRQPVSIDDLPEMNQLITNSSSRPLPGSMSLPTPSWARVRHFPATCSNVPRSKSLFANLSRSFRKMRRSSLHSSRRSSEENILLLRPSATVVHYSSNTINEAFDQTIV